MPTIPYLPFWGEVVIWVFVLGVVLNLVLWSAVLTQVRRFQKAKLSSDDKFQVAIIALAWIVVWTVMLLVFLASRGNNRHLFHLLGVALGRKDSVSWMSSRVNF